jgi:hypothetical protein
VKLHGVDLLLQAVPEMTAGWLPGDRGLSSAGLPAGWTMQRMDNGKVGPCGGSTLSQVLYVDSINGCHTWRDPRTGTQPKRRGGCRRMEGREGGGELALSLTSSSRRCEGRAGYGCCLNF